MSSAGSFASAIAITTRWIAVRLVRELAEL